MDLYSNEEMNHVGVEALERHMACDGQGCSSCHSGYSVIVTSMIKITQKGNIIHVDSTGEPLKYEE